MRSSPPPGRRPPAPHDAISLGPGRRQFGSTSGDGNAAGFERDTGAMLIGAEAALADHLIGGLGLGFGRSWVDADANLGDGTLNSYQAVLYGGATSGEKPACAQASAPATASRSMNSEERGIAIGRAQRAGQGEANGDDLAIDTEVATGSTLDPVTIGAVRGLRWDRLYRDAFNEERRGADSTSMSTPKPGLRPLDARRRIGLPSELASCAAAGTALRLARRMADQDRPGVRRRSAAPTLRSKRPRSGATLATSVSACLRRSPSACDLFADAEAESATTTARARSSSASRSPGSRVGPNSRISRSPQVASAADRELLKRPVPTPGRRGPSPTSTKVSGKRCQRK